MRDRISRECVSMSNEMNEGTRLGVCGREREREIEQPMREGINIIYL